VGKGRERMVEGEWERRDVRRCGRREGWVFGGRRVSAE
jgi:hypothetical protein